mmetsp:Transcript_11407/g.42836  ORF Transcript_11407/g.42836 Transcript_11407/m.42836 type:complete len:530 (-) Transcript_11407:73-1662(-)|eukprot:CAMPEP_0117442132 /NCGR_PEP_ID=MMETSP0759-20121206/3992_1 /TAXON_ID=63605 /ORGANISM="Percolomonas cosmopolitus, Strain WS" /LENGTH=529 /DNA_ID=CAMNT_0005234007 /DNA_START=129 /DNA_END=1718 /DNA_ORIENTATION=-
MTHDFAFGGSSSPHSQNSSMSPNIHNESTSPIQQKSKCSSSSRKRKSPEDANDSLASGKLFSSKKRKLDEKKKDDKRFEYLQAKHKSNTLSKVEKKEYRTLSNRKSAERSRKKQADEFLKAQDENDKLQKKNRELAEEIHQLRFQLQQQQQQGSAKFCPRCNSPLQGYSMEQQAHQQQLMMAPPQQHSAHFVTQSDAQICTTPCGINAALGNSVAPTPIHQSNLLDGIFDEHQDFNFDFLGNETPDDRTAQDILSFDPLSQPPSSSTFFKTSDENQSSSRFYAKFGGSFLLGVLFSLFILWAMSSQESCASALQHFNTNQQQLRSPVALDNVNASPHEEQCLADLTQCLTDFSSNNHRAPSFLKDFPHIFVPIEDNAQHMFLSQTEMDVEIMERANETLDFMNFHRPTHTTDFLHTQEHGDNSTHLSTQDDTGDSTYVFVVSEAPGGKHVYRMEAKARVLQDFFRSHQQFCETHHVGGNETQVLSAPLFYSEGALQMMKLYYIPKWQKATTRDYSAFELPMEGSFAAKM